MDVVESLSRNEVSDDPGSPVLVVIKIDQTVISNGVRASQNDAIVSPASMIVIASIYRHRS